MDLIRLPDESAVLYADLTPLYISIGLKKKGNLLSANGELDARFTREEIEQMIERLVDLIKNVPYGVEDFLEED